MTENQTREPLLRATGVHRTYGSTRNQVRAVAGISLDVYAGEVLALMGPSGCGKSTLLALLGGLDVPDAGDVAVRGRDWASFSARGRAEFRREQCGYIFQNLALLPAATAYENVEAPLLLAGVAAAERTRAVSDILAAVGMTEQGAHLPDQLSGGQQQRIGIARALVHRPALVFADEPTGSLDSANAQEVTRVLVATAAQRGTAVVLVTHDPAVATHASRVLHLQSGVLAPDAPPATARPAAAISVGARALS